ncbi:MAG: type II CAAX endopeptidase family protein [Anaerostipes sp.]|nr:type II CAAX endopeptidase family protein [Anaerostipes sp.]
MKYYKTAGCYALLYLVAYFWANFICGFIFKSQNIAMIATYALLLAFTIGFLMLCHDDIKKVLRLHRVRISVLLLCVLLVVAVYPFISFINSVSLLFVHDITSTSVSRSVASGPILSLVSIGVMPALVEEVIFRGVIFSKLRGARPVKGILLTALFFGFAHLNPNQMSYTIVIGIVLGLIVEFTDSIFPAMLIHFIFNSSSVIMEFFLNRIGASATETASHSIAIHDCLRLFPFAVASLILTLLLLYAIAHLSGRIGYIKTWFKKDIRRSLPKDHVTNASFYVVLFIFLLFTILMEVFVSL